MWKWLGLALLAIIALAAVVLLYPVGGVVWHASQVDRLAVVDGDKRTETTGRAAINEALGAVRAGPLRRIVSPLTGARCHPQDLEFHTVSGWVAARAECPGGFFLDYLPRPGTGRP